MSRSPRLIVCADCGRQAPHQAKGRCARCYPRTRERMIDCPGCGRRRPHHRGGRCARCDRLAHTTLADCAACGRRRPVRAGVCSQCKARRRARPGVCSRCRHHVGRLWSGRCSFCAKTSWSTGSCTDCLCWAASIHTGRCRACREFAARNPVGLCRSCRRRMAVNHASRCRLCVAAGCHEQLAGGPDRDDAEPRRRPGIQLFFGDMPTAGRLRRRPADDLQPPAEAACGQLELFAARPDPTLAGPAAAAWARTARGLELTGRLTRFGEAHGWPPVTITSTCRALALLAAVNPDLRLEEDIVAELRGRHLPPTRLRQFLTETGLAEQPAAQTIPAALSRATVGLPAAMTAEINTWADVLTGKVSRTRPHTAQTIASYLRTVTPVLAGWARQYQSLRQVTTEDITKAITPLSGSARTITMVALRSLFASLKARRMIFADPARRARPGRFPRHPPLPLDEATRGSLLAELDRPEDRLVVLLAGVHALSRSEITALRLADVDLAHGRLSFHGRRRVLDAPTRQALGDWLAERRRRWPYSANPHLLVSYKSAYDTGPVSTAYFTRPARLTGVTIAALRADRLLAEAGDTGGDPLSLVHLFGVSSDTAVRYCTDIDRDSRDTAGGSGPVPGDARAGFRR